MRRDKRLEMRLTAEERKLLEKAATLSGVDIGSWVRGLAVREARKLVRLEGPRR